MLSFIIEMSVSTNFNDIDKQLHCTKKTIAVTIPIDFLVRNHIVIHIPFNLILMSRLEINTTCIFSF